MLTLNRVRLINWHYFHDSTINLEMTTLIAGDNGSGKSTIIDAIQYALIADIRKIQFNAAAIAQRTERTLEGYCRCKIGATGMEYYRGDTISHVILEFKHGEKHFLAGVQVETSASFEIREQFYILKHGKIEDIPVYNGQNMTIPREFRERLKRLGAVLCPTKRDYNSRLTSLLGVFRRNSNFNPYFEALIRSVSFVPLVSVDRFVCDYILEERQVDISAMKENLLNYKEAEREADAMERKIADLQSIEKHQEQANTFLEQVIKQEYLENRLPIEIHKAELDHKKISRAQKDHEYRVMKESLEQCKDRQRRFQQRYEEITIALSSNDSFRLFGQYNREKEQLEQQLANIEDLMKRFNLIHGQTEALLGRKISSELQTELHMLSEEHDELIEQRMVCQGQIRSLDDEMADLSKEEQEVIRGLLRYPENTTKLQKALSEKRIEAWVFADLLEVLKPEWQNAVEGWLNTQRFNLLVEENQFQKALEVYDSLPKDISGVGLPHLGKMQHAEVYPGSLAEQVEASSPLARRYCAHLLGDVMISSIDRLKEHAKSVTQDCMKYSNKTASRIHESVYSRWYIGASAKQKRLEVIRHRLEELAREKDHLKSTLLHMDSNIDMHKRALNAIRELQNLQSAFTRHESTLEELKEVLKQLETIDTSEFNELKHQMESLKQQIGDLQEEMDQKHVYSGKLEQELLHLEIQISELAVELENSTEQLDQFLQSHQSLLPEFEVFYAKHIANDPSMEELSNKLNSIGITKKGTLTKLSEMNKQLRKEKEDYNRNNNTYMRVDGDDSLQFLQTLDRFKRTELPEYRDKIRRARGEAERQFKEHFVSRLNEYLIDARESFSELNSILKTITFGQDQYSFSLTPRQEKKHLLSVISGAAQIQELDGTLFDAIIDPEQRSSIERLFDSILENELDSLEVREICDYRMYFTYDIHIKHTATIDPKSQKPLESSLSKSLREKSGGETQTPYYVAIAASFFRFFKDDENAIRLVLFDEAFNKMDDDRIGNMLHFFKNMGIQVLTAVPTEKIETIAPHVDRINLVLRKDYRAVVREYRILPDAFAQPDISFEKSDAMD
jgi:uncharacterized protein YPO0396